MTHVTKESLSARIAELESGTRSIKEDYQLEAYRMLLGLIDNEPAAFTSQRSLEVRDKIVAFTSKESAEVYGKSAAWEKIIPLYAR